MSKEKTFDELLQEELDLRIKEIESPDYQYVQKLNKADVIGILATAAACVLLIIIGIV